MTYKDLVESLDVTKSIIKGLVILEENEVITDDETLDKIYSISEEMHGIRRHLEEDIEKFREDKYSIKETKEDTFRKLASGY